ncbi:MAG: YidC/Oxa1 family membrane protein insertase, partial [Butyrivibrio sp.]|nr:YidC/Oxa1 family membrane protein insertase [Butyrivibrio sp.]
MSVLEILDTLLFKPLQLVFEIIWAVANRLIDNPGIDIVALSLAMNFLVLPLYMRADAIQEDERRMENLLHKGVAHIKKTFSGDEQMMMLRTYYRQNDYKPLYVLRSAIPLFLEIPFFIAAYRFLSGLQMLNGVSFGPVLDLGSPDGMLRIAGMSVNVLPFIMTIINIISCVLFTKGSPMKTKLQLYGMAVFFLIFLYSSPSGLVFYWTLNNVFSLIKTIFYKLKNPRKVINIISSITGVIVWAYGFGISAKHTLKLMVFFAALGMLMQFPLISSLLKKRGLIKIKAAHETANTAVFLSGGLFLSILMGVLIPSAVIKSSAQEFIIGTLTFHIWYIIGAFCMALGIFVVWAGVFYWLAGPHVKPFFDRIMWIFSGIAVIDYMLFNKRFGNLSANLKYDDEMRYTFKEQMLNLIIIAAAAVILYALYRLLKKYIKDMLIIGIIAFGVMSVINIANINSSINELNLDDMERTPEFTLSKNGKNVVVIMLDRALGETVPYIFDEKPELKAQFDGFTYYSNTISFGGFTNFGSPALLGGYEYTPAEINKRDSEPLVEKHNEALKVMPVLFDENGYDVTVINPVYANYRWIPDLTIYDDYPDIDRYYTAGEEFLDTQRDSKILIESRKRNFFCYSLLKTMPLFTHNIIYDDGRYNQPNDTDMYFEQSFISAYEAEG